MQDMLAAESSLGDNGVPSEAVFVVQVPGRGRGHISMPATPSMCQVGKRLRNAKVDLPRWLADGGRGGKKALDRLGGFGIC